MTTRLFNQLAAVWGLTLLASVAALWILVSLSPEVTSIHDPGSVSAQIARIHSETDVETIREMAYHSYSGFIQTSAVATFLCRIALGTLTLVIIAAVVGLFQIRRIKKHLNAKDIAA
jgi:hypothetical protein